MRCLKWLFFLGSQDPGPAGGDQPGQYELQLPSQANLKKEENITS